MKNRAVRVALFALVALAFAGAGYELVRLDRQAAAASEAGRAFEEKARQVENALRELRAAQFAYVAAGQGSAFWTARATTLLSTITADLAQLDTLEKAAIAAGLSPGGPPGASQADDLATLQRIDANVQRYLLEDQRLLASDLVFTDLREADQALAAHIEEARHRMAAAGVATAEPLRRKQAATAGGAALFALLVLLLLVPSGRRAPIASDVAARPPAVDSSLRPPAVSAPIHAPLDLGKAAALCTDFARLREASQLPALLERAAGLLDASGIIVWMADSARGELRPAASHGYAAETLAHIRAVSIGDDNATAQAYRERALRIVGENALSNGAIAAPLLAVDGCVGVMAAEIRHGGEARADLQAAATILAAQLALLVAPAGEERS